MVVKTELLTAQSYIHNLAHWNDRIELIRVLDHSMCSVINGAEHVLNTGDVCLINREQLHRNYLPDGVEACTYQYLQLDPALFTADKNIFQRYVVPVLSDETFVHAHFRKGSRYAAAFADLLDRSADAEKLAEAGFEFELISLMYLFFQRIYQYYLYAKEQPHAPVNPDILLYRKIADYIYQNYASRLSLDDIAASGNVSRSKCCSVFKAYAGHAPIDFLNLYRLKISADLLRNSSDSIASIAAACGFGQQSYFNRLFLREYGMTPKAFRTT